MRADLRSWSYGSKVGEIIGERVRENGARALHFQFHLKIQLSDSGPTSNDLLNKLRAKHSPVALNYQIVAQSTEDIQNIQSAPTVSMAPYLLASGQIRLLTTISVYSVRGESREQIRLLYMNATAIEFGRKWAMRQMSLANKCGRRTRPS
jgi:hypothetical protein